MGNDVLQQLRIPAIGLIIVGSLNGLIGILTLISGILRLAGYDNNDQIPTAESERLGYFIGTGITYGIGFFSLILAPLIIYGGVKMLSGNKIELAKTAAILAILPLSSCCFIFGIPFGIWALVILRKPEVKNFFEHGMNNQFYPPQPPQNW